MMRRQFWQRMMRVDARDGEAGEDEEIIQSQEEEVVKIPTLPTPYQPTQSEVEDHRVDHLPFRCWCAHCMAGFGREDAHTASLGTRTTPVVSFDYLFMTQRGVFERGEWQPVDGGGLP